jgi:DNA-binding IclR family transcriptional regulator
MIAALSQVMTSTDLIIDAARSVVSDFAHRYGETCHVVELLDRRLLSLIAQESDNPIRVSRNIVSAATPVHATAPGRVLLAELPAPALHLLLEQTEFAPITSRTITDKSVLLNALAGVGEAAYASEVGEYIPDLASTAAPIRNHAGFCLGAFCLFIPAARFEAQPRAYASITREAAHKISMRLGWDPQAPSGVGEEGTRRKAGRRKRQDDRF